MISIPFKDLEQGQVYSMWVDMGEGEDQISPGLVYDDEAYNVEVILSLLKTLNTDFSTITRVGGAYPGLVVGIGMNPNRCFFNNEVYGKCWGLRYRS